MDKHDKHYENNIKISQVLPAVVCDEKKASSKPEKQEKGSRRLQYIAGILASLCMFISGNLRGWPSPSLEYLEHANSSSLHLSTSQGSWVASLLDLGSVPGSIVAGNAADYFGRRNTLLLSVPFYIVGWLLCLDVKSVWFLYSGRFISGFGIAIASAVCSMYTGESSEKEIRGKIGALIMFMNTSGVVFALSIGPFVSYTVFIIILTMVPIIFFVTFYWMPETPFFKLKQNDREGALKSLMRFRSLKYEKSVEFELNEMQQVVNEEMRHKTSVWELVRNDVYRYSLLIVLGVKTMQHFSGVAAIQTYMQHIFESTGTDFSSALAAIICGVIQMAAGIVSSLLVDRFGRKVLLLVSAIGCSIPLAGIGLFFYLKEFVLLDISPISWLPLTCIVLFMCFQPIGVGNLSYVLLGELFPTNVKGNAAIIATIYGSMSSFLVIKLFEVIETYLGIYTAFWIFTGCCILGVFFVIFFVMETKGKSLIEIQFEMTNKKHRTSNKDLIYVIE